MSSSSVLGGALASIPATKPPPGITSNLIDPPTRNGIFFGINTTLQVFMLAFVALRLKSKLSGYGRFGAEDYWCFLGTVLTTFVYCESAYVTTECKYGTHYWNVSVALVESRKFAIGTYLSTWPSKLAYISVRNSFFCMFLNLFRPNRWIRIASYMGISLNSAAYIAFTIVSLYAETPPPGKSWKDAFSFPKYAISEYTAIPLASIGLALDVYILLLPLAGIVRLQMGIKKKLGLMAVFSTGLSAVVASALGLYCRVHLAQTFKTDLTWAVLPVYVVVCAELQIGVICSCMPASAGLFRGNKHLISNASNKVASYIKRLLTLNSKSKPERGTCVIHQSSRENWSHENPMNLGPSYYVSSNKSNGREPELETAPSYSTTRTNTNV